MPRRVVLLILCALFAAGIATRVSTTDSDDNPYFRGAGAMAYRHAIELAYHHSLTAHDDKAGAPVGYVPARYRAAGMESLTGLGYRAMRLVSDMDGRDFARGLIVFLSALCVFTTYGIASQLWNSRGAGFLAAFLVAFEPVLVAATNGRTFSHAAFTAFFATLYAAIALHALSRSSRRSVVFSALLAFLLLWVWEPARYGLLAWMIPVSMMRTIDRRTRVWFVVSHATVVVIAACVYPHLVATRALGAWTTAAALAAACVALLPAAQRKHGRAFMWLLAGTAALTLVATPLRAGASEQFPALRYVLTRMEFAFGRPSASLLSDWMRYLWSSDHAPLAPGHVIQFFLPVLLCAVAWGLNSDVRRRRTRFATVLGLFVIASIALLLDRSILPLASLVIVVIVAGAASSLDHRRRTRFGLVLAGAYTALAGVVLAGSPADPARQIARAARVDGFDPAKPAWISFENTDKDLVRFLSTRTSINESILAPDDLSGLILAFCGRSSVALPGTTSHAPANRNVELMRGFYRDENTFYEQCRREKVAYVLYSIDMLLDASDYSPVYLTAVSGVTPEAVAVRMHFQPEALRHFTLQFENEHYRLFKVTDTAQPIFLTDHPLYYQGKLFMDSGGNFGQFRERVQWLMQRCASGMEARARGELDQSRQILDQCVRYAPSFTRARLELSYTFMDLGRYEKAGDELTAIIQYAPDNASALYAAACVQLQLGKPEGAQPYLTLLDQSGDANYRDKVKTLRYYIDHKLPLKPGAPQQ